MTLRLMLLITAMVNCPGIFSQGISSDGRYVWVSEDKSLAQNKRVLLIQATSGNWRKEIRTSSSATFSTNSRKIFYTVGDTLFADILGTSEQELMVGIESYKLISSGKSDWLVRKQKSHPDDLILEDMSSNKQRVYGGVISYLLNNQGTVLLLTTARMDSSCALQWVNLVSGQQKEIWSGSKSSPGSILFDNAGSRIAFMMESKEEGNSIWHYNVGMDKAEQLANNASRGISNHLEISGDKIIKVNQQGYPFQFTPNGERLLFYLKEKPITDKGKPRNLYLWSYMDSKIQSLQYKDKEVPHRYATVVDINSHCVLRLEQENEKLIAEEYGEQVKGLQLTNQYALLWHFANDIFAYNSRENSGYGSIMGYTMAEYNWNRALRCRVYLISLTDGSRKVLNDTIRPYSFDFPYYRVSPGGKYVAWFDQEQRNYFTFEITTGITRNISKYISVGFINGDQHSATGLYFNKNNGILGWFPGDSLVFIQDHYSDIWSIDPVGYKAPLNLTNDFAKRNNCKLLASMYNQSSSGRFLQRKLLLTVADISPSRHYSSPGYYEKDLGKTGDPQALVEFGAESGTQYGVGKAKDAHFYLVKRKRLNEQWRYFYTINFKEFVPVTSNETEERVAGNSSGGTGSRELVSWRTFDGTILQGILYKPKDFDPHKKYPVIFDYYEIEGDNPEGVIKIFGPGYLVFCPGIHFKIGETGPSTYNSVVSAAEYLAKLPFVDGHHMGIWSWSFGGYETNYLVAHSHIFAAAIAGAGVTDFISRYGVEDEDQQGYSQSADTEAGQHRLGVTPWERPDLYIRNSAVFYADKVTTPVLFSATKDDYRIPFSQSVEFFKALRRLDKPSWLLAAETGGHGSPGIRTFGRQFFDYYLKGAPAPRWMLEGIPARATEKELADYMVLDSTGRKPGPGLLYENETRTPRQQELIKHRTTFNEQGRIVDVLEEKTANKNKSNKK